ncbi:DUF2164 domain-containing protein [Marinobacterium arenosum]|uniref:DUF2164 domain-containing protein n=1 Tax=Marinobacterium arenosum TaxID=2862496 RepID=UPI001C95DD39|nr:DUF2164 domain-containing protein [Marinobacterium arenosum]MBY4677328.1 DUF2164 domain-containing protein [Marinobacterium arenosum]
MIKFDRDEKALLVEQLQDYFQRELDQEIGGFQAEFLLDFFNEQMGHHFYNRALSDVQALLNHRFELLSEEVYQLEQAPPRKKGR